MIVLHGSWHPLSDSRHNGRFFLWAETVAQRNRSPRGPRVRLSAGVARPHPGQVSARQVRAAWRHLAARVSLPAAASRAVVWLPSAAGRPRPAPELELEAARDDGAGDSGKGSVLAAWQVEGVALPAAQALSLLAVLPEAPPESWQEVVLGGDLRFWSQAAKLALELLARQQYLPAVLEEARGQFRAAWLPHLDDPADLARLQRLARAMPPVCRAMVSLPPVGGRARVTPANLPPARDLLDSFIASAVDGAVRHWGGAGCRRPAARPADVARHWQELLLERRATQDGLPPRLAVPGRQACAFYEQYQSWTAQLLAPGGGAFRICFRLEPPQVPPQAATAAEQAATAAEQAVGAEQVVIANSPALWTLRYFLQAVDDPSLLVPAEVVWRESGSTLRYLNRRFEAPQERLLSGLGQASRIFPALEASLEGPRPEACSLTTAESYLFLREAAPLLERAGFGLLVPPWWSRRGARFGLRLHVSPGATTPAGAGRLGLETLVRYDWRLSLGDEQLSREEFLKLAALKVPLVQVRGQWVELRPEQVDSLLRFWQTQGRTQEGTLGEALRLAQAAATDAPAAALPLAGVSAEGWVSELLAQWSGREPLALLPPPAGFHGRLRPYQITGVSWLAFLRRWGLGACLADDMGLGKTIQLLALLLHGRDGHSPAQPSLLICPTSAVGNWQREAARFAPGLRVLVHYGGERQSGADFHAQAGEHDLVISTYSLLYRDEATLAGVDWDGVILDEAQNIKNPATRQAQAARRLPARFRVTLTGTPVENRLGELWSLMEFLNPGYLGGQTEFRRRFALPIERYQDPAALQSLKSLVRPFLLRRVKSDPQVIQDLPEKLEMPVYCQLTAEQATLYQAVVNDALQRIAQSAGMERRGLVLAMLLKLKQVCNHPAQFLGDRSALAGRSGKLARLTEMLDEIVAAGDRALVFTQFAEMGEMLRQHLQSELHREALFLHGAVSRPQRERMIARFQDDPHGPPIFILSLKAGGTALNLMRATHVFHYDRWWNPAVENQATDRAYRIGQTRTVQVHKFICLGTLEERIAELIDSKRALAENVVDAGEGWLTELSTDELRDLLALRREAVGE